MTAFLSSLVKSLILPKPSPSYDTSTHPGKLIHIPRVDWNTRRENGGFTYGMILLDTTAKHMIVYAHTNAVDAGMMLDELSYLSKRVSASILIVEYTGYGIARGETTERSMNEDVLSAYYYVVRHLGVPASRVVLMGRSIGTGPSAQVCALLHDKGEECPPLLFLQSPFTSLKECADSVARHGGNIISLLGYNWFPTASAMARIRCPVIIQHGLLDDVVPIDHARQLKQVADESGPPGMLELYVEESCGHNDLSVSSTVSIISKKLREFGETRCIRPKCRSHLFANPPIYEYLFYANNEAITTVDRLLCHWNDTLAIGAFAYKRKKLHILLTASVSLFAMRCAALWQRYTGSWKRHVSGTSRFHVGSVLYSSSGSGQTHCSKEEIIRRCLACWGSPLGIYLGSAGGPVQNRVFGAHLPATLSLECGEEEHCNGSVSVGGEPNGNLSVPRFALFDDQTPYLSVAELEFTQGLLKCVVAAISTAPTLTGEGNDAAVFLQKDVVTRVQTECERVVAFLDDREWDNILEMLMSFNRRAGMVLSSKAHHYYEECASRRPGKSAASSGSCGTVVGHTSAEHVQSIGSTGENGDGVRVAALGVSCGVESIADIEEWLRPWTGAGTTQARLGPEVPWDYYLLKARICVLGELTLGCDSSWSDALRIVEGWRVVADIQSLFGKYSRRRLRPTFTTG
ncbi:putative serine peptidase [Trypanosoma vivax]|uniref:Putative serine peptidase n=1 Tax=Trypanosoma vivax (strain Y486) TaxID=1055687 RepID=G0TRK1_TRYVY|nr:putative serine peptidase [Trypanosoma vivax]CCC46567.1 putative serine peptidase [Trypanosoma vivax Y486]